MNDPLAADCDRFEWPRVTGWILTIATMGPSTVDTVMRQSLLRWAYSAQHLHRKVHTQRIKDGVWKNFVSAPPRG